MQSRLSYTGKIVKLFDDQEGLCFYCKRGMFLISLKHTSHPLFATVEHRLALTNGGKEAWENLVASCFQCNNIKSELVERRFINLLQFCKGDIHMVVEALRGKQAARIWRTASLLPVPSQPPRLPAEIAESLHDMLIPVTKQAPVPPPDNGFKPKRSKIFPMPEIRKGCGLNWRIYVWHIPTQTSTEFYCETIDRAKSLHLFEYENLSDLVIRITNIVEPMDAIYFYKTAVNGIWRWTDEATQEYHPEEVHRCGWKHLPGVLTLPPGPEVGIPQAEGLLESCL